MSDTIIVNVIKSVPHPNPQRLIDAWAELVVDELLKRDQIVNKNEVKHVEATNV